MDLRLDDTTHDLILDADGDLETVSGADEVVQRVRITFRCWAPEYQFDTSFGVPYRSLILRRNPDISEVDARLRAIAVRVPGINRLISSRPVFDADAREYSSRLVLDTIYGPVSVETATGFD